MIPCRGMPKERNAGGASRKACRGLFVTSTDTGVGKTLVSALLVARLRARGIPATYRKPVGCGGARIGGRLVSDDAVFVRRAAGLEEPADLLNPICLKTPAAPTVAIRAERRRLTRACVVAACGAPPGTVSVVEGVGGLLVPILPGWLVADLAVDLGLPVVVVARATLGTINHTLLTLEAARRRRLDVLGVVVNGMPKRPSRAEAEAPREIAREGRVRILGVLPVLPASAFRSPRALLRAAGRHLGRAERFVSGNE